jgi:hypothetical protein
MSNAQVQCTKCMPLSRGADPLLTYSMHLPLWADHSSPPVCALHPLCLQSILSNFTALNSTTPNGQAAQSAALKWISMLMGKCPDRVVVFEEDVSIAVALCPVLIARATRLYFVPAPHPHLHFLPLAQIFPPCACHAAGIACVAAGAVKEKAACMMSVGTCVRAFRSCERCCSTSTRLRRTRY